MLLWECFQIRGPLLFEKLWSHVGFPIPSTWKKKVVLRRFACPNFVSPSKIFEFPDSVALRVWEGQGKRWRVGVVALARSAKVLRHPYLEKHVSMTVQKRRDHPYVFTKKNQDHANPWRKNLSCPNCVCVLIHWFFENWLTTFISWNHQIKNLFKKNLRWYPQQHWAKIQPQRICVHYLALQSKAQAKRPHKVYQLISFVKSLSQKQGANLAFTTPFLHSITACKKRTTSITPEE